MTEQQAIETYKPTNEENQLIAAEQQPIHSGRTIPVGYIERILDTAKILQRSEDTSQNIRRQEEISRHLQREIQDDRIALEALFNYGLSREGIDIKYIERAANLYFPSREQMIDDLRKVNSIPTAKLIKEIINSSLLESLISTFPSLEFQPSHTSYPHYINIISRSQVEKVSPILRRRKTIEQINKHNVAELYYTYRDGYSEDRVDTAHITINDPLFLRACSDTMVSLKEELKEHINFKISHDYKV